jgi:hypothetical protein
VKFSRRDGEERELRTPKKVPPPTLRRSIKGGCSPQNN